MAASLTSPSYMGALRFLQILAGAATVVLLAYSHTLVYDTTTDLGIGIGAISIFYNIVFMVLLLLGRNYIVPKVIFWFELLVMILWLAAFIDIARDYGKLYCPSGLGSITARCNAGKGSIGSSAAGVVFFFFSTVLFGYSAFSNRSSIPPPPPPADEKFYTPNMV